MKRFDWKDTIAVIGVIISLLFVAYEIRQNSNLMRGQARQSLAELNQEWLVLLSQDSTYNAIFGKAMSDEELTESQESRARFMFVLHVRRAENVFFQYREGLVDESALNSYGLQGGPKSERFRKFWNEWKIGFDPEFVKFYDSRINN